MDENQKFEEMVNKYFEEFFKRNPTAATYLGKKEYEKQLEPGTKNHLEENLTQVGQWIKEAKQFDQIKLNFENRLAIEVMEYGHSLNKFLFETYSLWKRMPSGLGNTQGVFFALFQRKGPTIEVGEVIVARLAKLPKYLVEFQSRFDGRPIPKVWKNVALMQVQSAPQFLQFLAQVFANTPNIPESLQKEIQQAVEQVKPVIQSHQAWIQELPADEGEFAWALGEKNFDKVLSLRQLPWDRETILKKGYELLESLRERAKQVAKEINPTKTYEEVVETLKADHPPTFEMVLEHTRSEAVRAKEFVKTHDLATIPADDNLVVVPTPEYLAPIIPFAAYLSPPYFDRKQPGIYLVTPTKDEEGLKRHFYADIANTMVHEAYPGHHLDGVCRNAFVPLARAIGGAAETAEGWAHYCEEMMLQQGFHEDPKKAELVILKDQIWRAVRIIVDVELHCKQRTMEEAIKMLMDEAQMDQQSATAEVTRYTAAPGYQLSYLIGKLLIDDLRQDVEKQIGDKFSLKFFHDTILQGGSMPYYLLKKFFENKIQSL
ncbi:MAG: DUF885 domain-containing protein [Candidatus Hodarchaeota archaeon]